MLLRSLFPYYFYVHFSLPASAAFFFFLAAAFLPSCNWILMNLVFIRTFFKKAGAALNPIRATHTLSAVHSSGSVSYTHLTLPTT